MRRFLEQKRQVEREIDVFHCHSFRQRAFINGIGRGTLLELMLYINVAIHDCILVFINSPGTISNLSESLLTHAWVNDSTRTGVAVKWSNLLNCYKPFATHHDPV